MVDLQYRESYNVVAHPAMRALLIAMILKLCPPHILSCIGQQHSASVMRAK